MLDLFPHMQRKSQEPRRKTGQLPETRGPQGQSQGRHVPATSTWPSCCRSERPSRSRARPLPAHVDRQDALSPSPALPAITSPMLSPLSSPSRKCFVPLKPKALYVQTRFLFAPLTAFRKGTFHQCRGAISSKSVYRAPRLCPEQHRRMVGGLREERVGCRPTPVKRVRRETSDCHSQIHDIAGCG